MNIGIIFIVILGISSPLFAQEQFIGKSQGPPKATQRFNPDISLDGLFAAGYFSKPENLQFGAHDPTDRGFTLQNLELTMTGTVDPYFRAEGHLIFGLEDGESIVEVEEAHMTTLALPYGLQIMAGQFFTRFGRLNAQHPHAWDFVDQSVINTLMFGGDGLRNPGLQISALLPTSFYLEIIGSLQNAKGETAMSFLSSTETSFAGRPILEQAVNEADDLLSMGRLKVSFDFSETVTAVVGTSHLFGSNGTGTDTATRIHGIDFFVKWKPLRTDHGWPFVNIQGEAMQRSYEAGTATVDGTTLPRETFETEGFYLQSLYGFKRRWVAGLRYDFANATDPADPRTGDRRRLSANLSYYPSEFSKIRLQYNNDRSDDLAEAIHAVFLQFEFMIGAHAAHTF
ncbi:MAG: hypothetical protein ACE5GK_03980 [Nitrospiria bacterium]